MKSDRAWLGKLVVLQCLFAAFNSATALAQVGGQPQADETSPVAFESAPVVIDGRVLFPVQGIPSFPAEERAQRIIAELERLAEDEAFSPDDITFVQDGEVTRLVSGERRVLAIHDRDAAAQGVGRDTLATIYRERIATAIKAYREERTPRNLLTDAGYAVALILLLAGLLFLIWRFSTRQDAWIERRYKSKVQGVRIQSLELVHKERLWEAVRGVLQGIRTLVTIVLVLACAERVLELFPWTRPISVQGLKLILAPVRSIFDGILAAIPGLVFVLVLALFLWAVAKLLGLFFAGVEQRAITLSGFHPEWAWPTYKLIRFALIAIGVVVAYPYIPGTDTAAFKGVSILIGVVFSLGSSSFTSNIIAGYNLTYRRAFAVGDRVKIGETLGEVLRVRHQVTHLRSLKNEEVIIPNSEILNHQVVNYSSLARQGGLILHTTVGIGYETPWRQVESMLLIAAERTAGLLKNPPPFVEQKSLGDFCVVYELNVYSDRPDEMMRLYTRLHRSIQDVFNEYGVQIMTPAYVSDPREPKFVPKDKWFLAPASAPDTRTQDQDSENRD